MKDNYRTTGIRVEGNSKVYAKGNFIEGFDDGISIDGGSELTADSNVIKGLSSKDFEALKGELVSEIEKIVSEAKKGNSHKMNLLVAFLSQVGSGTLLGYLKSKGYIE